MPGRSAASGTGPAAPQKAGERLPVRGAGRQPSDKRSLHLAVRCLPGRQRRHRHGAPDPARLRHRPAGKRRGSQNGAGTSWPRPAVHHHGHLHPRPGRPVEGRCGKDGERLLNTYFPAEHTSEHRNPQTVENSRKE